MGQKIIIISVLFFITSVGCSQQNTTWAKWDWLMGDWIGEGSGQPGQGGGTFSFTPDLDENIIVRKSHSEYPASVNKPAVIHDDLMIIYRDLNGNPSNAIYFDNEGHTIEYQVNYNEKSIVLLSEKIPNVPAFRLTYTLLDSDTLNTKFEMSQDGENFFTYIEGKSIREK